MKSHKSFIISILFFIGIAEQMQSQVNVDFKPGNFPGKETELKKAVEAIKQGDFFYNRGPVYFDLALNFYLAAAAFNPNNAELNFLIGNCYLNLSHDKLKAVPYLERAVRLNPTINKDFLLALGKAYQYALEFELAIRMYEQYQELLGSKAGAEQLAEVRKRIFECENGAKLVRKPKRVRIDNLGPSVNSKFPDYAPVIDETESKLIFTSRRDNSTGGMVDPVDSLFFEDLYISFKVDGDWAAAKNLGKPVNTAEHDASVNLSPDGNSLIIYRTKNGGDLYESKLSSNKVSWSEPKAMDFINSNKYENHATYAPDGSRIYFISNRKEGNFGGKDIYFVESNGGGTWGPPQNAGPVLNTPYDEDGLYFHPDGKTLYFSSKGHNSMGGYDIFVTNWENGAWTTPENMGYPINTPDDDIYFVISKDKKRAFFASYREEGYGDKDIYQMTLLEDIELMTSIQVGILDSLGYPLLSAVVTLIDFETGKILDKSETKDLNGEALFNVPAGRKYEVVVTAGQYVDYSEVLDIPFSAGDQVMARNVQMNRDRSVQLSGFIYDFATLIPLSGSIEFIDAQTGEMVKTAYTDSRYGRYQITLPPGREYVAKARTTGYSIMRTTLLGSEMTDGKELTKSFGLTKINRSINSALKLIVVDAKSGKPIAQSQVEVQEVEGEPIVIYQKQNKFDGVVYPGQALRIRVKSEGYMTYEEFLEVPQTSSRQEITRTIRLSKLTAGSSLVLHNIFFDFNKATLRPASFESLALLKQTMQKYNTLKIEVSGHTDNVGSENFNQLLSERRAKVVHDYLIRNGIAPERLTYVGKGFKEPIASNETDEGRQLNRRTELKIITQ